MADDNVSTEDKTREISELLCGVADTLDSCVDELERTCHPVKVPVESDIWDDEPDEVDIYALVCSECGAAITSDVWIPRSDERVKVSYCPNCGARVVRDEDS